MRGAAEEDRAAAALRELGGKVQTEDGHVVSLSLAGDRVTDRALENLKMLPHLRALSLDNAALTDEGVKKLKEALPELDVYYR
jgi:hypothetical protein